MDISSSLLQSDNKKENMEALSRLFINIISP